MTNLVTKTENKALGRGSLFFNPKKTDGTYEGFRPIGNTTAFGLNITTQTLKHYSSASGVKVQDLEVPVQTDYAASYTTDNSDQDNLASLLLGTTSIIAQTSATAATHTITGAKQGRMYQIGTGVTATGVRRLSNVVVTVSAATKTAGTDYLIDLERGLITIIAGGGIADAATVLVTYDRAAVSRSQTVSASTSVEGQLLFISDNPVGANIDYLLRETRISPNGEFNVKADEWQTMPFNVAVSTPLDGHAVLADGQPYVP
jgi:hypothetical protein